MAAKATLHSTTTCRLENGKVKQRHVYMCGGNKREGPRLNIRIKTSLGFKYDLTDDHLYPLGGKTWPALMHGMIE